MAWVGSDDAICHIGTGLHKIALARMQEVFLLLQERNRLEIYEVISAFPNVRNTLQGSCQVAIGKSNNDCVWKLSYDSMIDGTGKELLAGKDENVRKVDLQIAFADANAIAAVVPNPDGIPWKRTANTPWSLCGKMTSIQSSKGYGCCNLLELVVG